MSTARQAEGFVLDYFRDTERIELIRVKRPERGYDFRNADSTLFVEVKGSAAKDAAGVVVTEEQRQRLIALFEEQQRARAELVVSAAAPDESQVQVKQPEPQWPSIGVDATYLPEPQPAADQDPDGLAEGWGLNHPELS